MDQLNRALFLIGNTILLALNNISNPFKYSRLLNIKCDVKI